MTGLVIRPNNDRSDIWSQGGPRRLPCEIRPGVIRTERRGIKITLRRATSDQAIGYANLSGEEHHTGPAPLGEVVAGGGSEWRSPPQRRACNGIRPPGLCPKKRFPCLTWRLANLRAVPYSPSPRASNSAGNRASGTAAPFISVDAEMPGRSFNHVARRHFCRPERHRRGRRLCCRTHTSRPNHLSIRPSLRSTHLAGRTYPVKDSQVNGTSAAVFRLTDCP